MDIRPEVQEACDNLHGNDESFISLWLRIPSDQDPLNPTENEALIEALRANTHVMLLLFRGCHHSGPENSAFMNFVVDALIPSHPSLIHLVLDGNQISDGLAESLAGALKRNTKLKELVLGRNKLSENGVQAIAEGVRHNSCLTGLGIIVNGIGSIGCQRIVSSISAKPNFNLFKILFLAGNNIGVEGGKMVAGFIQKAKTLEYLSLQDNNLGDEGCRFIASALPKALQQIYLSKNYISDPGCMYIANSLRNNSTLKEVDLNNNNITDNGVAALQATLQHINYTVQRLDLSNNEQVSNEQRECIEDLCNTNLRIKKASDHLKSNLPKISLALWPKALELVETKPDLLFHFIKSKPELFRERPVQRKRKLAERLQY